MALILFRLLMLTRKVDNSTGTPVASFGGYGNYGVIRTEKTCKRPRNREQN